MKYTKPIEVIDFEDGTGFYVSRDAHFLKDKECYRVSVGISAVYLTNEFAEWLRENQYFTFGELLEISGVEREDLNLILNMLAKYKIINRASC